MPEVHKQHDSKPTRRLLRPEPDCAAAFDPSLLDERSSQHARAEMARRALLLPDTAVTKPPTSHARASSNAGLGPPIAGHLAPRQRQVSLRVLGRQPDREGTEAVRQRKRFVVTAGGT